MCGHSKAWHERAIAVEVKILLANGLHCKQRLKAEGRMSLDYESWETGVVVGSAELVDGQAKTVFASQVTGTRSSSVTNWVGEAAAQAAGRVAEASTFASWVDLRTGLEVALLEAAENSEVILCQAGDCGCMCVAVGVVGSRDGRRYCGQRTDAHVDVALGGDVAQNNHFLLQVMVSRHGSTQAYQVAGTGCHSIEAVEAWVARSGGEVGNMVGTAALQSHWRSLDDKSSAAVEAGWGRQHHRAVAARGVVVRCLVGRLMRAVCFRLAVLQDCHSTSC